MAHPLLFLVPNLRNLNYFKKQINYFGSVFENYLKI